MTCSILLKRFGCEELKPFEFVTSDDEMPSRIRLILPSPFASYIVRTSYFEDSGQTQNNLPIYKEVEKPASNY